MPVFVMPLVVKPVGAAGKVKAVMVAAAESPLAFVALTLSVWLVPEARLLKL